MRSIPRASRVFLLIAVAFTGITACGGQGVIAGKNAPLEVPLGSSEHLYEDGLLVGVSGSAGEEKCSVPVTITARAPSGQSVEVPVVHVVIVHGENTYSDTNSGNERSLVGGNLENKNQELSGSYCFPAEARERRVVVEFRTDDREDLSFDSSVLDS